MFLTLEDERARIKGSRDPLGLQAIWAPIGRQVVTNLTTVTTSLRGFTTLLLGRYFAEQLIREGKAHEEDALPLFLRFEQITGYARHIVHDAGGGVRGIDRVRRNLDERSGRVVIGDGPDAAILADQKTYGLWGLFSVAARVSGLISPGPVGVTKEGRDFVEANYLPRLKKIEDRLHKLMLRGGELHARKNDAICSAIASVMKPLPSARERQFYRRHLRDARTVDPNLQTAADAQQRTADLLSERDLLEDAFDRQSLIDVQKAARSKGDDVLADRLQLIDDVEALIAPAEHAFLYLLTQHGQTPKRIAEKFTETWGSVPNLTPERWDRFQTKLMNPPDGELHPLVHKAHDALMRSEYVPAIEALVDWNGLIMKRRSGYPWVGMTPRGTLDVRYREEEETLPHHDDLPTLWRNSYFLESLRTIAAQLTEPS